MQSNAVSPMKHTKRGKKQNHKEREIHHQLLSTHEIKMGDSLCSTPSGHFDAEEQYEMDCKHHADIMMQESLMRMGMVCFADDFNEQRENDRINKIDNARADIDPSEKDSKNSVNKPVSSKRMTGFMQHATVVIIAILSALFFTVKLGWPCQKNKLNVSDNYTGLYAAVMHAKGGVSSTPPAYIDILYLGAYGPEGLEGLGKHISQSNSMIKNERTLYTVTYRGMLSSNKIKQNYRTIKKIKAAYNDEFMVQALNNSVSDARRSFCNYMNQTSKQFESDHSNSSYFTIDVQDLVFNGEFCSAVLDTNSSLRKSAKCVMDYAELGNNITRSRGYPTDFLHRASHLYETCINIYRDSDNTNPMEIAPNEDRYDAVVMGIPLFHTLAHANSQRHVLATINKLKQSSHDIKISVIVVTTADKIRLKAAACAAGLVIKGSIQSSTSANDDENYCVGYSWLVKSANAVHNSTATYAVTLGLPESADALIAECT